MVVNDKQTPLEWLPHCYFYQLDVAGLDRSILFDWARQFVEETEEMSCDGQYLLLLMDAYAAHVRCEKLNYLEDNKTIVFGIPSHTSHILQPLDASCVIVLQIAHLQRIS